MSTVGKAYIQIIPTTKNIKSMLERSVVAPAMGVGNKAGQAVGQGINKGVAASSSRFGSFLKPVTDSLGLMGIAAAKLGDHFSQSMNIVKASTNAPQTAIRSLSEEALKLGTKGIGSANDVAAAMEKMARAGMDTNEIMKGTAPIMKLAAAAQVDVSETAAIAVNHLKEFGLSVDQLPHSMDIMGKLIKTTGTSLEELGSAFSYAGPVARETGMSFEKCAGVIGMLARSGIEGSRAGTDLRRIISSLMAPGDEAAAIMEKYGIKIRDTSGKMRDLADIMGDFKRAGLSDKEMKKVFLLQGITPANILMRNFGNDLRQITKDIANSNGVVDKLIKAYNTTLSGGVKQIKDSISTMITSFSVGGLSSVQAVFGTIVLGVNTLASAVVNLGLKFPILKDQMFSVALSFGLFKTMPRILLTIGQGLEKAGFAGKGLMKVLLTFSRIGNIFALIMVPLSFLAPLFKKAYAQSEPLRNAVHALGNAFGKLWGALKTMGKSIAWAFSRGNIKGVIDFKKFTEISIKIVEKLTKVVTSAADKIKQWAYDLHTPGTRANQIFNMVRNTINTTITVLKTFTQFAITVFKNVVTQVKSVFNWLSKLSHASKITIAIAFASAILTSKIMKIIDLLKVLQITRKMSIIIGIVGYEMLDTFLKKFDYLKKNNTVRTLIEVAIGTALLRLGAFMGIVKKIPTALIMKLSVIFTSALLFNQVLNHWKWMREHANIKLVIAGVGAALLNIGKIKALFAGVLALLAGKRWKLGGGIAAGLFITGMLSGFGPLKDIGNKIASWLGFGAVKKKAALEGGNAGKFFKDKFIDNINQPGVYVDLGSQAVKNWADGLYTGGQKIPVITQKLGTDFKSGLEEIHFGEMGRALSEQLISGMKSNNSVLQKVAEDQFQTILKSFNEGQLNEKTRELLEGIPKALRQGGPAAEAASQELMAAIQSGMRTQGDQFYNIARELVANFVSGVDSGNDALKEAGKAGLYAYLEAMDDSISADKANEIVNTLVDALRSKDPDIRNWANDTLAMMVKWRDDVGDTAQWTEEFSNNFGKSADEIREKIRQLGEDRDKDKESHKSWIDSLTDSLPSMDSVITGMGFLASSVVTLGGTLRLIAWLATPVRLVTLAIGALVGAIGLCIYYWDTIKDHATEAISVMVGLLGGGPMGALIAELIGKFIGWRDIWDGIKDAAIACWEGIQTAWNACLPVFEGIWEGIKTGAQAAWDGIVTIFTIGLAIFQPFWEGFKEGFMWVFNGVIDAGKACWEGIKEGYNTILLPLWNDMKEIFNTIILPIWNYLKKEATDTWNDIKKGYDDNIKPIWDGFKDTWEKDIKPIWNEFKRKVEEVFNKIKEKYDKYVKPVIDGLKNGFKAVAKVVGKVVGASAALIILGVVLAPVIAILIPIIVAFTAIVAVIWLVVQAINGIKAAWRWVKRKWHEGIKTMKKAWRDFVTNVKAKFNAFINWFKKAPGRIADFFKSLPGKIEKWFNQAKDWAKRKFNELVDWFRELPGKIANFFSGLGQKIADKMGNLAQKLKDKVPAWARPFLGISSLIPIEFKPLIPGGILLPPIIQPEMTAAQLAQDKLKHVDTNYIRRFDYMKSSLNNNKKEEKDTKPTVNNYYDLIVNAKTEIDQRRLMKDMTWYLRHMS